MTVAQRGLPCCICVAARSVRTTWDVATPGAALKAPRGGMLHRGCANASFAVYTPTALIESLELGTRTRVHYPAQPQQTSRPAQRGYSPLAHTLDLPSKSAKTCILSASGGPPPSTSPTISMRPLSAHKCASRRPKNLTPDTSRRVWSRTLAETPCRVSARAPQRTTQSTAARHRRSAQCHRDPVPARPGRPGLARSARRRRPLARRQRGSADARARQAR